MTTEESTGQSDEGEYTLRKERYDPILVTLSVDNFPLEMEVDTGASLTGISEATIRATYGEQATPPRNSQVKLKIYTGDEIPVFGMVEVNVQHNGQSKQLPLNVTRGEGPSLLGRNWLGELRIDWRGTYKVQKTDALSAVLDKHEAVFRDELGTITCAKASLRIDPQALPEFHPPRPVPFSLRRKVEEELERLKKQGIIRPREFSEWAAPIVAVPKADGSIRICGDYKITMNKAMVCDTHPIPRSEGRPIRSDVGRNILYKVGSGTVFRREQQAASVPSGYPERHSWSRSIILEPMSQLWLSEAPTVALTIS